MKRNVAAGADHMKNTVPAGKPYTTAKPDTFGQKDRLLQVVVLLLHRTNPER